MVFNPIIQLILALVAGAAGILLLNATDSWLSLIPCLFFILLFFLSLALPGITGSFTRRQAASRRYDRTEPPSRFATVGKETAARRPSTSPFTRFEKLTPERLRSHSRPPLGVVGETARRRPPENESPHTAALGAGT